MKQSAGRVVLVCYGSKEQVIWDGLLPRLMEDPYLKDGFCLSTWPGEVGLKPRRRRLTDALSPTARRARNLHRHLRKAPFVGDDYKVDPDLTLVGFGKGCRVIQAYLLNCLLEESTVRHLRQVRQVIFICPSKSHRYRYLLGAAVAAMFLGWTLDLWRAFTPASFLGLSISSLAFIVGIISLIFGVISNPAAMEMIGFPHIQLDQDDLERQFGIRILNGCKETPGTWPIPVKSVALPDFGEDEEDDSRQVSRAIADPVGHKNLYDIELFERRIVISPTTEPPPGDADLAAVDNLATIHHTITLSAHNQNLTPWELRYQTYKGHIEVQDVPSTNRWTPQERSAYENTHKQYIFRFIPEPAKEYVLSARIWNGFSKGSRDSHAHLRADAYFRRLQVSIDLRPYLLREWRITRRPEAYFFPGKLPATSGKERDLSGPSCDCVTSKRILEEGIPIDVDESEPGLFEWKLEHIRDGGIVGFVFDVSSKKESANAK